MTWSNEDLAAITEAVAEDDGLERLTEHFADRRVDFLRAVKAADDLASGRAVEAGNGLTLSRDCPDFPTGGVVSEGRTMEAGDGLGLVRDFSTGGHVLGRG